MDQITLQAVPRKTTGRKNNILRAEGKLPGVVYGHSIEPSSIVLERNEMERVYNKAGESTMLKLEFEGNSYEVLIQDVQRDPLTGFLTHIDFRKIDMASKLEAVIELVLNGSAPAVKELGGTLVQNLDEVEVEALPNALVREIEVDVSSLKTFDDVVRVKDIQAPEGVEILNNPEQAVASVQPPRSEEELAALDEVVEENVDAVEVTTEKKDAEEEEGAEKKEENNKE